MNRDIKNKHLFTNSNCLSEKTFFDYIDNKQTVSERNTVEKHLLHCELCSDAMDGLELVKSRKKIAETHTAVSEKIYDAKKGGRIINLNFKTQLAVAASLLLLLGSVWFFKNNINNEKIVADKLEKPEPVSAPHVETPLPYPAENKQENNLNDNDIIKEETNKISRKEKKSGFSKNSQANVKNDNTQPETQFIAGSNQTDDIIITSNEGNNNTISAAPTATEGKINEEESAKKSYEKAAGKVKREDEFAKNKSTEPRSYSTKTALTQDAEGDLEIQALSISENKAKNIKEKLYSAVVEQMPAFPGGEKAMEKFIEKNLVYPASAKKNSMEGKVYATFVVEKDGTLSDIKLLRGINGCEDCDKEAIRVIKLMPSWNPGKQNGKLVRVQYNLPLKFALK